MKSSSEYIAGSLTLQTENLTLVRCAREDEDVDVDVTADSESEQVDVDGFDASPDLPTEGQLPENGFEEQTKYAVKEEVVYEGEDETLTKAAIFEPEYDIQQSLTCPLECDATLLNGLDSAKLTVGRSESDASDVLLTSAPLIVKPQSDASSLNGSLPHLTCLTEDTELAPDRDVDGGIQSPESSSGNVDSQTESAAVSSSNSSGSSTTTAFAQVTRIEPGEDNKGYVLHLNIPALGMSNVTLFAPGLSITPSLGTETKAFPDSGDLCTMAEQTVTSPPCGSLESGHASATNSLSGSDIDEHMDLCDSGVVTNGIRCTSPNLADMTSFPRPGEVASSDLEALVSDQHEHQELIVEQEDNKIVFEPVEEMDSGPGLVQYTDTQFDETEELGPGETSGGSSSSQDGLEEVGEMSDSLLNVVGWVEKPAVERFVICSDGPMECVLCAFKTESYSAFKSHIICSHPCWRITKKLSKNRLLVEKSVKMSVGTTSSCFVTLPKPRKSNKDKDSGGSSPGSGSSSSNSGSGRTNGKGVNPGKSRKHAYQHQRKKQMLERNKRLFRCSLCLRLFVFEGSIVNHLIDHHHIKKPYDIIQVSNDHGKTFGKIHRCSYKSCYVSCGSEEELERHRVESHAQVVFRCQICGYTADSADAVKAHATRIHHQQVMMYGLMD